MTKPDETEGQDDEGLSTEDIAGFSFDEGTEAPDILAMAQSDTKKSSESLDSEGSVARGDEGPGDASREGDSEPELEPSEGEVEEVEGEEAGHEEAPVGEGEVEEEYEEEDLDTLGPVEIAGNVYDNWSQAEQAVKSSFGQQARALELQRQVDEAHRELIELKSTPKGDTSEERTPEPKAEEKAPKKLLDAVDLGLYRQLTDDPEYGPEGALIYTLGKLQEHLDERDKANAAQVDEQLGPFKSREEAVESYNNAVKVFSDLSERVDAEGNAVFPELLEDEQFIEDAGRRFLDTPGLKEQGEQGAYMAVLAERDWRRYNAPAEEATTEPEEEEKTRAASEIVEELETERVARTAEEVESGEETAVPREARRGKETEDSVIIKGILSQETKEGEQEVLGFDY